MARGQDAQARRHGDAFLRDLTACSGGSMPYPEEDGQIHGEKDDDDDFQPQHARFVHLAVDDAVKLVQLREPLLDAGAPLVEIKPVARAQIDAGEMPIAKELGDMGDFIGELGDIHAEPPQLPQRFVCGAKHRQMPPFQVVVGAIQVKVEPTVHHPELLELEIGQFQRIQNVVHVTSQIGNESSVPINHGQIGVLKGALDAEEPH